MKDHEAISRLQWHTSGLSNSGYSLTAMQLGEVIAYLKTRLAAESTITPDPPPDTVRARIAVAQWQGCHGVYTEAYGIGDDTDADALETVQLRSGRPAIALAIIEADIPKIPVIRGRVAGAKADE